MYELIRDAVREHLEGLGIEINVKILPQINSSDNLQVIIIPSSKSIEILGRGLAILDRGYQIALLFRKQLLKDDDCTVLINTLESVIDSFRSLKIDGFNLTEIIHAPVIDYDMLVKDKLFTSTIQLKFS